MTSEGAYGNHGSSFALGRGMGKIKEPWQGWGVFEEWALDYYIDVYFQEPPDIPVDGKHLDKVPMVSPLCQLRHDIEYCLGIIGDKKKQIVCPRPIP